MQHHAADELHVEVPHVQHAAARLAHDGERLRQEIVERLALARGAARNSAVLPRSWSSESALDRRLVCVDWRDERARGVSVRARSRAENLRRALYRMDHRRCRTIRDEYAAWYAPGAENVYRASSFSGLVSFPFIRIS